MFLKRILVAVAALVLAVPPVSGQLVTYDETQPLFYVRNVSAAAYEYCAMLGATNSALGPAKLVQIPIETAGSSTTTSASNPATQAPFLGVDVGDELTVVLSGLSTYRYVVTNADDDTVTVDTTWDLGTTGVPFRWRDLVCGTGADDGLIPSGRRAQRVVFDIQVLAIAATSLDVRVEGRNPGAGVGWTPVGTATYTATGGGAIVVNQLHFDQYRLGIKVTGDAGTQSVTAKVTVIG